MNEDHHSFTFLCRIKILDAGTVRKRRDNILFSPRRISSRGRYHNTGRYILHTYGMVLYRANTYLLPTLLFFFSSCKISSRGTAAGGAISSGWARIHIGK